VFGTFLRGAITTQICVKEPPGHVQISMLNASPFFKIKEQ
jgi:hypothetical protein